MRPWRHSRRVMRLVDVPEEFFDRLEASLHFRNTQDGFTWDCGGDLSRAEQVAAALHLPWPELKSAVRPSVSRLICKARKDSRGAEASPRAHS